MGSSTISTILNGIKSLRLSIIKTRCSLASPKIPSHAVNSIRSIRSKQRLTRSAATLSATLPVTSRTSIPHYPAIATGIHIDGLLDIRILIY